MSRPPRPIYKIATTGDGSAFAAQKLFLPIEFAEFVKLQRELAGSELKLGVVEPAERNEEQEPSGDFAATLMELSALIGHTLGLYQNLYAREAYLGTAATSRSLVLHARRLAYEPDQGLSASGYAVLTVGEKLQGGLPAGFALASSPRGEVKAQTFETIGEIEVDAARNESLPVAGRRAAQISFTGLHGAFRLDGTGLNLEKGGYGMLVRDQSSTWEPVSIADWSEDDDETIVQVDLLNPGSTFADTEQALADAGNDNAPLFRFLALPKERLQRFGWNANPVEFPAAELEDNQAYAAPTSGYEVRLESGSPTVNAEDVFLSAAITPNLLETLILARRDNHLEALKVTGQENASVAFRRQRTMEVNIGVTNVGVAVTDSVTLETELTGTVTSLKLQRADGTDAARADIALPGVLLADWQFEADVLPTEPNEDDVVAPLELQADFGEFRPGGFVVFETLDGDFSQVVVIYKLTISEAGTTEIYWTPVTADPDSGWQLNNLRVFGNVARITHGETQEETLGGSDGVTPFQQFELKKSPLTQTPGAAGGEPAIQVFVNEVEWTRVEDFALSGPDHRHYRLEFSEDQKGTVIFGNGRNGAIPPSGKKHITASYRHGLGIEGNVDAGAASRIKKAHPLINRAVNPTEILGGADPAGVSDLERQATQFIRTFDRAVSVQDHADLALLFPGVARAAARTTSNGGIEVIVATAAGGEPPISSVETFLNARRDTMLPMAVRGPEGIEVFLTITIKHDPAYLTENIKRAVQDALVGEDADGPGLFTFAARDFGQAAHLSEIYARVADVEGVKFVDVTRFRLADEAGVSDVVKVSARQWLRVTSANLDLDVTPAEGTS